MSKPEPLNKENFRKHKAVADYLPIEEWVKVSDVESAVSWRNSLRESIYPLKVDCPICGIKTRIYQLDEKGIIGCSSCATKKAFGIKQQKVKSNE